MKQLAMAVSVMIMLILPGWGQQTAQEQAKAGAAAHREEARNNPNRPHERHKHRRHHRRHKGA
jgi:hypothetical protein